MMKSIQLKKKIGGALLAFSILFGLGLASATTANAQWGNNDQYRREQRRAEREQRRRQREYEREQRRRNRDNGYYGNNGGYYGNNGGYNGGYNGRYGRSSDGYGNYGGSFELRQTALNAGANEGVKEGRRDRERGERFDYADESVFQNATKDYSSRLGDRETYRRYFREAFINGYTEGYRGY